MIDRARALEGAANGVVAGVRELFAAGRLAERTSGLLSGMGRAQKLPAL